MISSIVAAFLRGLDETEDVGGRRADCAGEFMGAGGGMKYSLLFLLPGLVLAQAYRAPRAPDGHADLQGVWQAM